VIVKGLNWTGSGAVVDLLKEFQAVEQIPGSLGKIAPAGYFKFGEFNVYRTRGGIIDTIEGTFPSNFEDIISRLFSARELIRLIINPLNWKTRNVKSLLSLRRNAINLKRLDNILSQAETRDYKVSASKEYIQEITIAQYPFKSHFLFDQAIHFCRKDELWQEIFAPAKCIIVIRDFRDSIAEKLSKKFYHSNFTFESSYRSGFNLSDAIVHQIETYKILANCVDTFKNRFGESVMIISFEELVLDYTNSLEQIISFLGLHKSNHKYKHKYFDPSWSKNNIGIYEKHIPSYFNMEEFRPLIEWYNLYSSLKISV